MSYFRILGDRATLLLFTGRRVLQEHFEEVPGGVALSKEGRAFFLAHLNERLDECRARSQILMLDCCHSGAFARGTKGDRDPGLDLKQRFQPTGRGRVVLTASRATEYSFEGDQVSGEGLPSIFTRAVVDGLTSGEADRDRDGLITVSDLYQHVYEAVRAAEPRQTPELWTYGAEGDLLVARSVRGAAEEPPPLPSDLQITLESPRAGVRASAVAELARLLDTAGPGMARTARQVLQYLQDLPGRASQELFVRFRQFAGDDDRPCAHDPIHVNQSIEYPMRRFIKDEGRLVALQGFENAVQQARP